MLVLLTDDTDEHGFPSMLATLNRAPAASWGRDMSRPLLAPVSNGCDGCSSYRTISNGMGIDPIAQTVTMIREIRVIREPILKLLVGPNWVNPCPIGPATAQTRTANHLGST